MNGGWMYIFKLLSQIDQVYIRWEYFYVDDGNNNLVDLILDPDTDISDIDEVTSELFNQEEEQKKRLSKLTNNDNESNGPRSN